MPCSADSSCSIERSLSVLGERWTFLVLREAFAGVTRFADFRLALGVAADVLSTRLDTLVDAGVMIRQPYQEPGQRLRESYHLTPAGADLRLVLAALQQWGDANMPTAAGPSVVRRSSDGHPVDVSFVDDRGSVLVPEQVCFERTAAYPSRRVR